MIDVGLLKKFCNLLACGCDADGSTSEICDKSSGKCDCKDSVVGDKCTQCSTEHWGFPNCQGEWHLKILFSRKTIENCFYILRMQL